VIIERQTEQMSTGPTAGLVAVNPATVDEGSSVAGRADGAASADADVDGRLCSLRVFLMILASVRIH